MNLLLGIGTGAVGLRDAKPSCRTLPERCAEHGHPFVTHNPWHDICACLCGARWGEGNGIKWPKADGHDGPLHECAAAI